jgi:hypothetical protein
MDDHPFQCFFCAAPSRHAFSPLKSDQQSLGIYP